MRLKTAGIKERYWRSCYCPDYFYAVTRELSEQTTLPTITHGSHNSQDLIFNARQLKNRWKHDLGPTWIMLIGGYKELKWWNVSQVEEAFDMTRVVNLGR